jgi:uncharacterized membrane protein
MARSTAPSASSIPQQGGLDPRSASQINALVHLYRAEVGRLTTYRTRLDTTTNWAITTTALVCTFTLGNPQNPQAAFLVLMLTNYFFLHLEARRFRAYETSRHRVQLLEHFFYAEVLGATPNPRWIRQLLEALQNPGLTVNRLGALGWRLRRNYLWIFAVVLLAWLSKLHTSGTPTWAPSELAARAAIGGIPAWLVIALVGTFYVYLAMIAVAAQRIYPLGDDEVRHMMEDISAE